MVKIAPKGKKVTGTKKKDKITWVSKKPWKKALTVKAGAGNDVINFKKSGYKNTIYGEAGKDTIYGGKKNDKIYGGKGNDKINAGKGKNTLYFSKGDGTDTILNGKGTDTLVFKSEKNIKNIKVAYSGNDAIITYTKGKVILKDYKKGGHSAKYLQVGSTKKAIADYFKPAPAPAPIDDKYFVINGTDGNDNLTAKEGYDCKIYGGKGNDTIKGGNGNDIIYAGAGDDVINTGLGNNYIYLGEGANTIVYDELRTERRDTIVNFGPNDTLYFPTLTRPNDLFFDEYNEELDCLTIGWNSNNLRINILDYSSNYRNGFVKFGDNDPMRMEDFLATHYMNPIRIYTNDADTVENIDFGGKIYTRGGNDTITNVHYDNGHYLFVYSGAGDDSITGIGSYSSIFGGTGDDIIETGNYKVNYIDIYGEDGDDVIRVLGGAQQATFIHGGAGNDTIEACQTIKGEDGDDDITVVSTNVRNESSWVTGGAGNDILRRASGNTDGITYTFSMNNPTGNDILYDDFSGESYLSFGFNREKENVKFVESLKYYVSGNDLIIRYKDTATGSYENNSITIKDYITSANKDNLMLGISGNSGIPYGTTLEEVIAQVGYTGEVISASDGNDTIDGTQYNDTIYGLGGKDTISAGAGKDYIDGGDGDDVLDGGADTNTIHGGAGNDVIYSFGTDSIYGGKGNDTIHLYENVNKEIFIAPDEGNDVIAGGIDNTAQTNLNFDHGTTFWAGKDGNSLIINSMGYKNGEYYQQATTVSDYYNGDELNTAVSDKLTINGSTVDFSAIPAPYHMTDADNHEHTSTSAEFVFGTDGDDTITGSDGDDTIFAGGGILDEINGKGGNDTIYLGSGNATLKVDMSVITATVHNEGTDYEWSEYNENCAKTICMKEDTVLTLDFDDELFNAGGLGIFCRGTGLDNDLYISLDGGMGYCLRIKDYFDENRNPKVDSVILKKGGETYTVPEWANGSYWGRTFDVQPFGAYTGEIHGTNMPYEWLMYTGGFGQDDTIYGGNGNTENIYIRQGNDVIYANEGTKNLYISGNKSDSEIYIGTNASTKTTITLGGVDSNYTQTVTSTGDLYLSWNCHTSDTSSNTYSSSALIYDWTNRTSQVSIGIVGDSRGNTLRGINGVSTLLDGREGNDYLYGGTGADIFNFTYNNGYGIDTIEGATSADILQFESASTVNVNFNNFKFYKNNDNNLVINTKGLDNEDSFVIIKNYYTATDKIDRVVAGNWESNNEERSLAEMLSGVGDAIGKFEIANGGYDITGTDYTDVMICEYGRNTISGGAGEDKIYSNGGTNFITAGEGADSLYLNKGDNTYIFNAGDGSDTIYQGATSGTNTLEFKDATIDQLTAVSGYDRQGYDLLVHYDGTSTLTIKDYYNTSNNIISYIKDSTGTRYKASDYFKRVEYINSTANYYTRYAGTNKNTSEDIRISSSVDLSSYVIEGYGGSDRIWGTDYDEWLYTGTSANAYTYDSTAGVVDEIHAGGGDDYIFATSETNILYGDAGDDSIYILAGANNIVSDSSGEHDFLAINSGNGTDNALYSNLHFVFNVDVSGNVDDAGLRILTNDEFSLWQTNTNHENLKGIQVVKAADGTGSWDCIETFEDAGDNNGCSHLSVTALQNVKADIASWLSTNGYADVADVLANEKTDGDIATLIAKFDVTTQWTYEAY